MSKRAPRARKNSSESRGESSIKGEAMRWFRDKANYQHPGRIKGLSEKEIGLWLQKAPAEAHLISTFKRRAHELEKLDKMSKDTWGKHMTRADDETFETFVEKEDRLDWLNCLIIAEAEREETRQQRIAAVNKRKQQLQ